MNECSEKKMHFIYHYYTLLSNGGFGVRDADMKDQDYHVFGQDDHDFGDGRPGDHHEILLKLWP